MCTLGDMMKNNRSIMNKLNNERTDQVTTTQENTTMSNITRFIEHVTKLSSYENPSVWEDHLVEEYRECYLTGICSCDEDHDATGITHIPESESEEGYISGWLLTSVDGQCIAVIKYTHGEMHDMACEKSERGSTAFRDIFERAVALGLLMGNSMNQKSSVFVHRYVDTHHKEDTTMEEKKQVLYSEEEKAAAIERFEQSVEDLVEDPDAVDVENPLLTQEEVDTLVAAIDQVEEAAEVDEGYVSKSQVLDQMYDSVIQGQGAAVSQILQAIGIAREVETTLDDLNALAGIINTWKANYEHGGACLSDDPRRAVFEKVYMDAGTLAHELGQRIGKDIPMPVLPKRVEKPAPKQEVKRPVTNNNTTKETDAMRQQVIEQNRQRTADLKVKHNVQAGTRPKPVATGAVVGKGTEAIIHGTVVASKATAAFTKDVAAPAIATGAKTTWSVLKGMAKGIKEGYVESKNNRTPRRG